MNEIDLSIIIPVYNINEKLLTDSLNSVIDNKTENIEVIIIDDGSRNEIAEVCDKYNIPENDVYVFHQLNQGVSVARNKGIMEAHGKYIAFVDSDDVIEMSAMAEVTQYASNMKLDICFFKYRRDAAFSDKDRRKELEPDRFSVDYNSLIYNIAVQIEPFEGYCLGSPWGKIFQSDFLKRNNLFFLKSLRKMQDRVFMMYCLKKEPQIAFLPLEGYCYVVNIESIVNKYNPKIGGYISNVYKEIKRFNGNYNSFKTEEMNTIACKLIDEYLSLDILHKMNTKSIDEKKRDLEKFMKDNGFFDALSNFNKKELNRNTNIKLQLIKYRFIKLMIWISAKYKRR